MDRIDQPLRLTVECTDMGSRDIQLRSPEFRLVSPRRDSSAWRNLMGIPEEKAVNLGPTENTMARLLTVRYSAYCLGSPQSIPTSCMRAISRLYQLTEGGAYFGIALP